MGVRQRADLQRGLPAVERLVTATSTAEARSDIAPAIAAAARQVQRDRRTQQIQIEQDITEKRIGLELLSGRLEEAWPG